MSRADRSPTDPSPAGASPEISPKPLRPRFRAASMRSLAPNILTVLALCAGLTSFRLGLAGEYERAAVAIIVAMILDGLDGRLARMLEGATRFGAELDSLTDFFNFGVAPVLLLYVWGLSSIGGVGWIAVLAYAICCALRLARFNVALDEPNKPAWKANYFVGVPAPGGAGLALLPLFLDFMGAGFISDALYGVAIYVGFVGFLMVSQIPTFSAKRMRIRRDLVLPMLVLVAVLAAAVVSYPWGTLFTLGVVYLAMIPVSLRRHRTLEARAAASAKREA